MRRILSSLLALPLLLATVAATSGDATPAEPCHDTTGREVLTTDGFDLTYDAPVATAPELAAGHQVTGDLVSPYRAGAFFFTVDVAPHEEAAVELTLSWEQLGSDFDIFVIDGEFGHELGRAANFDVVDEQDTQENLTVHVSDCQTINVLTSSWAGSPAETLTLDIDVTGTEDTLRTDVGPRPADARQALYLSGDRPGNLGTLHQQAPLNQVLPQRTAFSEQRPTGGQPNVHVRPVAGFNTEANPFQPFWPHEPEDFPALQGDASALVWVSSPSMDQQESGTLEVQLWINGQKHAQVFDGIEIGRDPTPLLVEFPDVDTEALFSATFQVATEPVVSSTGGESDDPGDLNHNVWYDSIQFQSRVFLPTVS